MTSISSLAKRIEVLYDKGTNILKVPINRRGSPTYLNTKKAYDDNLQQLFNISKCNCDNLMRCCCTIFDRVPLQEHDFFNDQKSKRNMYIASVDVKYSEKLKNHTENIMKLQLKNPIYHH